MSDIVTTEVDIGKSFVGCVESSSPGTLNITLLGRSKTTDPSHTFFLQSPDRLDRGGGEDFSGDAGVEAEFARIDEALQQRGDEVLDGKAPSAFRRHIRPETSGFGSKQALDRDLQDLGGRS